jgi:hypothetical protein
MKKIVIAASLMFVATAQASEMEIGVEMTPVAKQEQVVAKSDARFESYALENSAAGGQ